MTQEDETGSGSEAMTKGPLAITLLGAAILIAGVVRFARLGHFTWIQAGICLLLVPVSILMLFVTDYTLHHSRLGLLIILAFMLLIAVASPGFCVALGLALIGMMVTKWP